MGDLWGVLTDESINCTPQRRPLGDLDRDFFAPGHVPQHSEEFELDNHSGNHFSIDVAVDRTVRNLIVAEFAIGRET